MASRLTPSSEVRISCFPYHSCSPVDQLSRISLPTSSPGSHPEQHEPTGLARLFASAKLPPNPLGNTAGQRPGQPHQRRPSQKKPAGNLQPATGRTDRAELETTDRRPDTRAESDSTTMHRQAPPPPPAKTTGEYSSDTAGPNVRATALVLETDGHSTRSTTNRSIHFSVTSGHTDTIVGIGS